MIRRLELRQSLASACQRSAGAVMFVMRPLWSRRESCVDCVLYAQDSRAVIDGFGGRSQCCGGYSWAGVRVCGVRRLMRGMLVRPPTRDIAAL